MTASSFPEVGALLQLLRNRGLGVDGAADGVLVVAPRGRTGPEATIELPEDLLVAYLDALGRSYAPFDDDPRATARDLLAVQLADALTVDHGGGVNRVRRVAMVDGDEGPQLVEQRTDDPGPPPTDGPHDDPTVFAAELEALAAFLRDQGVDAVADPAGATLRLTVGNETLTLDLRPDLYRRWFEATQGELEAIGGDPRDHAWRLWCRMVASLPAHSSATRAALVESPDGEVLLRPDEPEQPGYVWSANPGV